MKTHPTQKETTIAYYGPPVKCYIALSWPDQKTELARNKSLAKLITKLDKKGVSRDDYIISYEFEDWK